MGVIMGRPKLDEKEKTSFAKTYSFTPSVIAFFKAEKKFPGKYLCGLVEADKEYQKWLKSQNF